MPLIKPDFSSPQAMAMKEAIAHQGALACFPTETSYGLGCAATLDQACQRVYQIKQRSFDLPLPVLINGWDMLETYTNALSANQQSFLRKHWPGPLSVILPARNLAPCLNRASARVAFRMSRCRILTEMIGLMGLPLVGTSANLTGKPPALDVAKAQGFFGDQVQWYVDGGVSSGDAATTLVDLDENGDYRLLRQGVLRLG